MENTVINENNSTKEIDIWKKKLLDLGKRNNLINYKDTKSSTLEILHPSFDISFDKITNSSSIQIFDDKLNESDDIFSDDKNEMDREEYLSHFINRVPQSQLLVFNHGQKTKRILKSLMKKALDSITERGVNILYVAFGFMVWKDNDDSNIEYKAPLLLVPITISNDAVNKPYYIHHFDDEVSVNTTFSYLLENQFGIKLPEYEDNIEDYFKKINDMVSPLGWYVIEEARISIFSFNKLNMYFDLDNNEKTIIENPNVKALTNAEVNSDIFISGEELDEMAKTKDLFIKQHNVVDADFSQTEAIEYAMMGKSFVLQGPPGTGKSQTITNMIAELIYAGKKVLFVSEKMAALEVVYNNLKKAKLSDFCLELHSYKANKKDFIDDLYQTLNTPKTIVADMANDNMTELNLALNNLNNYDSELYKVYEPINLSLYQLIGFANHLANTKEVPYIINDISSLGKEDLAKYVTLLNKYASYEKSIGYNYKLCPLYGLNVSDLSYAFKLQLANDLNEYKKSLIKLMDTLPFIKSKYNLELVSLDELKAFVEFVNFCDTNKFTNESLFNKEVLSSLIMNIDDIWLLEDSINSATIMISKKYDNRIFEENIKEIYDDYSNYGNSVFKRIFNSRFKSSKRKLTSLKLDKKKVKYDDAIEDLRLLLKREANIEKYKEIAKEFIKYSISQYEYLNTDWYKLRELLKTLQNKLFETLLQSNDSLNEISFKDHNEKFFKEVMNDYNNHLKIKAKMDNYVDRDVINLDLSTFKDIKYSVEGFIEGLNNLDIWVEFNRLLSELKENKLLPFIDIVINEKYPIKKISDYYKLSFYKQWIDYIFNQNPKLYSYSRFEHEKDVNDFSLKDRTELDISKALINEKLSKMRPDPMLQMAGSPASIIMREHEKKRKLKPIRMLMKEIPDFIQELKPCFLMSPLSVSTFLSDEMKFDVTIFDEASQVFPEDAIVAIYRSKQLIVVGDSKQMPPTKFFMTSDTDDEEFDEESSDIDSYESILDLCTTTFPTKSLLCHYRSKDEGLINFSNKNFYKYNLVTYPSVHENKSDLGVDFVYVNNGIMDSKTKINLKEAEKVVDLVFEHYKKYPNRSLGVVAFNIKQQDAILKLLDKRRSIDPSLEEYFKADLEEPFFVKNLETVQGDERDTIIFSITYAKNDKGQFALRFGPLNLIGGERRLNVAITRAKLNVKVVSSIKAIDIDINKVTNAGPKLLREYLDYAEHGKDTLDRAVSLNENEEFDSPFEEDVYKFLIDNGYDVSTQVGCSKYRIDLGLKRPGTNDYVLAIECDGATYHSAKSARDRDRLRKSVLEKMDWGFYRIWSTDWYKNNLVEKKALLDACDEALKKSNTIYMDSNKKDQSIDISDIVWSQSTKGSVDLYDEYTPYRGRFVNDPMYMAQRYTEVEGPISIDFLLKQICKIFGYEKATQRVKDSFDVIYSDTTKCIREDGFLYGVDQKNYAMRKNLGENLGDINYISDYEIRNGMYSAIAINVSCKKEDLFSFIRTQLGFSRAGDKITRKLESAFELLMPYVEIDSDGDITLNKKNPLKIIRRNNK